MTDPLGPRVTDEERAIFDQSLEQVLRELPPALHDLLEEVPLIVEDHPSTALARELSLPPDASLCGLHTGIPLTERSVNHSGTLPDRIQVFRDGVINQSLDRSGWIDPHLLRQQIRITVLHEIGHHFGLDEDQLARAGYA